MEQKVEKKKKGKKGKYILLGIGVVALSGAAIYFATRPKKNNSGFIPETVDTTFDVEKVSTPVRSGGSSSSGFPLKKGSRGDLVRNIQEAIIKKYGASALPRYGADGIWGNELQTALIANGISTTITTDIFTTLVGSKLRPKKKKFNPALLAKNLRLAILDDDLNQALSSLSKIWTVKGYTRVNEIFKEKRIEGIRKTLVNGLLTKFPGQSEKKKLNAQFHRMGLKFNGSQWSLSGINGSSELNNDLLQTVVEAVVWSPSGLEMNVTKDTILGDFIDAKNGITKFRTAHNEILFIHTKNISYV